MLSPFTLNYLTKHAQAAAESLEQLEAGAVAELVVALAPAAAAPVFVHMLPQRAAAALAAMPPAAAAAVLDELEFAQTLRHLYPLDLVSRQAIVQHLRSTVRQGVVRALAFPPDSIGRAMRGRVEAFRPRVPVTQALAELGQRRDSLATCFIIDEQGRPIGVMTLAELIGAAAEAQLLDIMRPCAAPISALARLESVRDAVLAEGDDHLPVVDGDQRLIGVLAKLDWARAMERTDEAADAPELISLWLGVASLFWQVGARVVAQSAAPSDDDGASA